MIAIPDNKKAKMRGTVREMEVRSFVNTPIEKVIDIIVNLVEPDKIILFGSRATDKYKHDSDYDLCILKEGVNHRRKLARQIYRSLYGVGIPVDIIVETPDRFSELKGNPYLIYNEIDRTGMVIFEKKDTRQ